MLGFGKSSYGVRDKNVLAQLENALAGLDLVHRIMDRDVSKIDHARGYRRKIQRESYIEHLAFFRPHPDMEFSRSAEPHVRRAEFIPFLESTRIYLSNEFPITPEPRPTTTY